jgi:regulator of sigma E protease
MISLATILMKYLIGLVGITVVVIIHEIGHLLSARANGIEVEVFSFGIGPKLWGKRVKGTEFRISLLPLGGYCRLKGSDDLSQALIHGKRSFTHTEEGSLFGVHPLKRALTYLSGPVANIIFSLLIFALLASLPHRLISTEARVATINDYPLLFPDATSPAYESGLRNGDLVTKLGTTPIEDWEHLETLLFDSADGKETFTVLRNAEPLVIEVEGEHQEGAAYRFGLTPLQDAVVGSVRPATAEAQAGLHRGDRIIRVDGHEVSNHLDLHTRLAGKTDDITLTVLRDGKEHTVSFIPARDEAGKPVFGFSLQYKTKQVPQQPFRLANGWETTTRITAEILTALRSVLQRDKTAESSSEFTGMARSALLIGDITSLGFEQNTQSGLHALLYLMGIVSISLALANSIPLPAFDGGQIVIALVEWMTKRQIRPKTYYVLQLIGIGCVLLIFLLLTLTDIRHFLLIRR